MRPAHWKKVPTTGLFILIRLENVRCVRCEIGLALFRASVNTTPNNLGVGLRLLHGVVMITAGSVMQVFDSGAHFCSTKCQKHHQSCEEAAWQGPTRAAPCARGPASAARGGGRGLAWLVSSVSRQSTVKTAARVCILDKIVCRRRCWHKNLSQS